ncbi:MAG TPA: nitrate reductase molybdenum cofactor assembly chaperone [Streptosporangiaceae bacterium]|nr:nitrate reductase molybdenum cofactor assembly chaperone [Streptosporangiaceae bacterium]
MLLQYPDEQVYGRLGDITAAVTGLTGTAHRDPLARVADWLGDQEPGAAQRHYVQTFDLSRRCSPYLTYYKYGDTRQRGMALLALKHVYRRAGLEPAGTELPDYLPAVLEFAALAPGDAGARLLTGHRAGLELLRQALHAAGSPYAEVLDAVTATLPAMSARQAADVRRLAADGPPAEQVGLDPAGTAPFAPPELLGGRMEPRP